ncbi:MAG: sensor histidine kinase, partial [Anaeroplasmataceae bacterium]
MIKKLKKKYIIVTMLVLFSVFFIVVATINTINYINVNKKADNIIDIIEKNNGQIPGDIKPQDPKDKFDDMHGEMPFSTRYFTVTFENNEIVAINLDKIATIDSNTASEVSESLYAKNKKSGFYNDFKYRLVNTDTGQMYIFLDCTMELENFHEFLIASIWTSVGGLLIIFILVFIASSIVTKPIAESYSKQKEFITNINHEIKTPLSIIKATNEVIELENGGNEWTEIIDKEINKLTDLTESLVYLSRMDEENNKFSKIEFNLTQVAYEVSEPFVVLAESKNKELNIEIEEN